MGKTLRAAKLAQSFVRLERKSVTSLEIAALGRKHEREIKRDAYYAARREMIELLDKQMDAVTRGLLATKVAPGTAYGARDLQTKKARALSMNSWRA
jgi:hypothetical protein